MSKQKKPATATYTILDGLTYQRVQTDFPSFVQFGCDLARSLRKDLVGVCDGSSELELWIFWSDGGWSPIPGEIRMTVSRLIALWESVSKTRISSPN